VRRCQRLPEVTHLGDPARPSIITSRRMPARLAPNRSRKGDIDADAVLRNGHVRVLLRGHMRWTMGRSGGHTRPRLALASVGVQVSVDFPVGDLTDVAVPLRALGGEEMVEDVVAERFSHQRALFEFVERLVQIAR
jgi:hypothetical protein